MQSIDIDWAVAFGEEESFPGFGMAITFAFLQIDGVCFVRYVVSYVWRKLFC